MLSRPNQGLNEYWKATITKSNFKQCFQHMLSPETFSKNCLSSPLFFSYILLAKRNLSIVSFVNKANLGLAKWRVG